MNPRYVPLRLLSRAFIISMLHEQGRVPSLTGIEVHKLCLMGGPLDK